MAPTSVPAIGVAPTAEDVAAGRFKVYASRPATQWRLGFIFIGLGLLSLLPLRDVSKWLSGGPMPDIQEFFALACVLFVPIGILAVLNALRGLPRLTITPRGIKLDASIGARWANWDSLEPFAIKTTHGGRFSRQVKTASAKVIGYHASRRLMPSKTFLVPDHFLTPIGTIVAELNAARAQAVGVSESLLGGGIAPPDAPVGLAAFKLPWLTLALLAVLVAIFACENEFAVTPSVGSTPSIATLFALGALNRTAVLSGGEWYRLFTAPLLHANLAHILGNGVALLLGGWLLERLVGRLWFFAFFVIGALGGSLMSLAVGPAQLISVGASGALMGMFAALFVGSFRLASGTPARLRLQFSSLRILVPSLLPLFSSTSTAHIDYGAHFGGALSGAAVAALLLKSWPATERIPQLRTVAAGVATIGAILFVVSAGIALANYPKYDIAVIPQAELPRTAADRQARAANLAARYPDDPRSHLYVGEALAAAKDNAGAERELRLALTNAQAHSAIFGSQLELITRGILALFLAEQDRRDEAKELARPTCSAPAGDKAIDNFLKLLAGQHLCD
jgi:rhomboid protease GluP